MVPPPSPEDISPLSLVGKTSCLPEKTPPGVVVLVIVPQGGCVAPLRVVGPERRTNVASRHAVVTPLIIIVIGGDQCFNYGLRISINDMQPERPERMAGASGIVNFVHPRSSSASHRRHRRCAPLWVYFYFAIVYGTLLLFVGRENPWNTPSTSALLGRRRSISSLAT